MNVAESWAWRRLSSVRISTRSLASRLESGSSMRKTAGLTTIVRASATRCASPPDSVAGRFPSSGAMRVVVATACTRAATSASGTFLMRNGKAMLSKTFRWGNSARLWNTMPRLRSRGSQSVTRAAPMKMSPAVGVSSPAIMLSVVVLPQPDGPTSTTNSPSGTARSMASTARVEAKSLVSFSSRTAATLLPQEAEGEAAHEVFLDQEAEDDDRERRDRADGGLGPIVAPLVGRLEFVEGDRNGRHLGVGQRHGQEELAPVQDEDEEEGDDEARGGERQDDAAQDAEARGAHDPGGVLELDRHILDEGQHHPDDVGQRGGEVHEDEAHVGVEHSERDVVHHEGHRDHDRRHHADRQDVVGIAPPPVPKRVHE